MTEVTFQHRSLANTWLVFGDVGKLAYVSTDLVKDKDKAKIFSRVYILNTREYVHIYK